MQNEIFTGVLGDPRTDERVQNGWKIDEILAESAPLNWRPKFISELVQYPVWNQSQSSACVAFSKAKQVSIKISQLTGTWLDFSPSSIYQLRSNRPQGGMNIADANEIVSKRGTSIEALMKSQNLTETQINSVPRTLVADLFAKAIAEAVVSYLYIPINIDRIAQSIESGKSVSLLIFGEYDEYSRMVPMVTNPNLTYEQAPIRHEIVAVDYYINSQNQKVIHCNDSAHFGGIPLRDITEDFLTKRCILADAIDVFTFDPDIVSDRPSYDGVTIISAQKCLRYEGLFPNNVDFVENLGPVTRDAINKFQRKYGLHPTGTGTLGPLTKGKLKELYP